MPTYVTLLNWTQHRGRGISSQLHTLLTGIGIPDFCPGGYSPTYVTLLLEQEHQRQPLAAGAGQGGGRRRRNDDVLHDFGAVRHGCRDRSARRCDLRQSGAGDRLAGRYPQPDAARFHGRRVPGNRRFPVTHGFRSGFRGNGGASSASPNPSPEPSAVRIHLIFLPEPTLLLETRCADEASTAPLRARLGCTPGEQSTPAVHRAQPRPR